MVKKFKKLLSTISKIPQFKGIICKFVNLSKTWKSSIERSAKESYTLNVIHACTILLNS